MRDRATWLQEAKEKNATHLIIVLDTFDYEDYPVFVLQGEELKEKVIKFSTASMQSIQEIITL